MNCIQLAKSVLDELFHSVDGETEEKKFALIDRKLDDLSSKYKKLLTKNNVSYENDVTKFAYIYRYVSAHANYVNQVINKSTELRDFILDSEKLNITCIGGGPGSDLLGFLKFLIQNSDKVTEKFKLKCTLLDKEESWGECWSDVDDKISGNINISTNFRAFDVTNPDVWLKQTKYLKADIFSMIYFASEVYALKEDSSAFFEHVFEKMESNKYVLFIDNNTKEFYSWIDEIAAARNDIIIVASGEEKFHIEDYSEQKDDFEEYSRRLQYPRLNANLCFRIFRKK